jgi:hypothetical protein
LADGRSGRGAAGVTLTLALAAGLAVDLAVAVPANAQEWRTMTVSRQVQGEERLQVRVRYGAGELRLRPGAAGILYRMDLRYDEESFDPVAAFADGRLELGVDARKRNIHIGKDRASGHMDVELARDVPMELDLEFGAVRADIDLGGLRLARLDLSTGASESSLDVSQPNPDRLARASLSVGAADFTARRLANLNAERLEVSAGVGEIVLDFSGEWRRDLDVSVGMGLGSLELRFPRGLGVELVKKAFLTSLDSEGLIKRGDAYYSPDWDEATHRVTVEVEAAFGSVEVVWLR